VQEVKYKRQQKVNHKWTDEERAIVRRDYRGTIASADAIANNLGVTRFAVRGQAAKMGILRRRSPPWTRNELKLLEEMIPRYSVGQMAKKLHRSPNAVKVKAVRLKLKFRARDGWYTKKEVCEIVGEDHHKVQKWIDSECLKASWHHDRRPCQAGMAAWHIEASDLRDFIIKHCAELLGRNVDLQQIVWLLTNSVNSERRSE